MGLMPLSRAIIKATKTYYQGINNKIKKKKKILES